MDSMICSFVVFQLFCVGDVSKRYGEKMFGFTLQKGIRFEDSMMCANIICFLDFISI